MTVFHAKATADGGFELPSDLARTKLREFLKENAGMRLEIRPITPESPNQRAFYHGAVIPLWAYLDGKDHKDSHVLEYMHEVAKREFNGEIIRIAGKPEKVGKSSKGMLNDGYLERVIDYLVENYGIDSSIVLNPETYKKYRDEIFPESNYESFIEYLVDIGLLK